MRLQATSPSRRSRFITGGWCRTMAAESGRGSSRSRSASRSPISWAYDRGYSHLIPRELFTPRNDHRPHRRPPWKLARAREQFADLRNGGRETLDIGWIRQVADRRQADGLLFRQFALRYDVELPARRISLVRGFP